MIEREPGDTSPIFSERARGQMQTAVTRQSAGALRRGRRKAAAGRSGSGLTPLAAMVRKMLERDVPRDVIVTAIKAAERHAFVTLRHAPSHHSQSKAALRARRYRENKKAAASRDAQHAPSLSNNNIIKKERGRSTRVTLRDDFVPDWQSASSVGLTRVESEREFQKFKNHAQQHGKTCVDWQAPGRTGASGPPNFSASRRRKRQAMALRRRNRRGRNRRRDTQLSGRGRPGAGAA